MIRNRLLARIRAVRNVFDSHPRRRSGHKGVPLTVLERWYARAFPHEELRKILNLLLERKALVAAIVVRVHGNLRSATPIECIPSELPPTEGKLMLYLPYRLPTCLQKKKARAALTTAAR